MITLKKDLRGTESKLAWCVKKIPYTLIDILELWYNDECKGYRFTYNNKVEGYKDITIRVDIDYRTVEVFKWIIKSDKRVKLEYDEESNTLVTKSEKESGNHITDISEDFARVVETFRALDTDCIIRDEYCLEDIKKIVRRYYNFGADVVSECWDDKELNEYIEDGTIFERMENTIEIRKEELADFANGAGYYW